MPSKFLTAKKSLSQNFLNNQSILDKIEQKSLNFLKKSNSKAVLEIGPGHGELTKFLVKNYSQVIALELDKKLVEKLKVEFEDKKNLEIYHLDAFQEIAIPNLLTSYPQFDLVSNLPYKTGSRILMELPIYFPNTCFTVILQKEVVLKTISSKSQLTFFGVWIGLFWETKKLMEITPNNFSPSPKVNSAMIGGKPKNLNLEILGSSKDRKKAMEIVKKLFNQPNKTIKNNLTRFLDSSLIFEVYKTYNWSENLRLTWNNYENVIIQLLKFLKEKEVY